MIECEVGQTLEELLFKVGGGHVVVCADELKHGFKHSAGGSAGWHELGYLVPFHLVLVPYVDVALLLCLVGGEDTVLNAGCGFEAQEWEPCLEAVELGVEFLLGDTLFGKL